MEPILDDDDNPTGEFFRRAYSHASAIVGPNRSREEFCLSMVSGLDFSALDADPEIIDIFEDDHAGKDRLTAARATLRQRGKGMNDETRIKAAMTFRNVDARNLNVDSTLTDIINRIGKSYQPDFDCERLIRGNRGTGWDD